MLDQWRTDRLHALVLQKSPPKCLTELHCPEQSTPTRFDCSSSCAGSWTRTQSAQTASSTLTRPHAASCLCNDDHDLSAFRDAVTEAAALHSHHDLFSRHIEPEPTPEDPAMTEASDDDTPMPDRPPEPEIIHMPPAPASARSLSNLERCIALRLVYGAESIKKKMSHMSVVMCVLPGFPDTCPLSCASCPGSQTVTIFFLGGRGDGLK